MAVPLELQALIDEALVTVRAHPLHWLDWQRRRALYVAFGDYSDSEVKRARGRLAILSAQKVYPIFHIAYPDDDLPERLLQAAVGLLNGTVTREVAARVEDHGYHGFGNDLYDEWNADRAGFSAYKAIKEVRGWQDPFKEKAIKRLPNGKWVPFDDKEFAETAGAGDTAGVAALAFANGVEYDDPDDPDPDKSLEFWEWWLTEAIPAAWNPDVQIVAVSTQPPIPPGDAQTYFEVGLKAAKNGWREDAIAAFDEAIRLAPDRAEYYLHRGFTRGNHWDYYEGGISDLNVALSLDPTLAEAYLKRAEFKGRQGEYEAAIADFTEHIRLEPGNSRAYEERARIYTDNGNYQAAIADFDEAIRLKPTNLFTYVQRGRERLRTGNISGALADYIYAWRHGWSRSLMRNEAIIAFGAGDPALQGWGGMRLSPFRSL